VARLADSSQTIERLRVRVERGRRADDEATEEMKEKPRETSEAAVRVNLDCIGFRCADFFFHQAASSGNLVGVSSIYCDADTNYRLGVLINRTDTN
jgi:hypothetical protein